VVERFAQLLALSDTQVWSDIHKHRDVLKGYLGASFSDFADALGRADFAGALATLMDHKKGGSDDDETRN
jgi:hypothetical protein